jgi:hypothetical protein
LGHRRVALVLLLAGAALGACGGNTASPSSTVAASAPAAPSASPSPTASPSPSPTASPSPTPVGKVDPCKAVTASDITKVLGSKAKQSSDKQRSTSTAHGGTCTYSAGGVGSASVTVQVFLTAAAADSGWTAASASAAKTGAPTDVSGVGTAAVIARSGYGTTYRTVLTARSGNTVVFFNVSRQGTPVADGDVEAAASRALARLGG